MSKSPAEYKELLAQVYVKLTSKEPESQGLLANDDFKNVVEELVRGFQEQNPGMEGMMAFAREHEFDSKAVMGMWMAVGVSAATRGAYQDGWVSQLRSLLENVGTSEEFSPAVMAMVDAYEAASNGHPNPEISHLQEMIGRRQSADPINSQATVGFIYDMETGLPKEPIFSGESNIFESPLLRDEKNGGTDTAFVENTARIDIDEFLSAIKSSPEVERALTVIADDMEKLLSNRKANSKRDDDGPGL